MNKKQIITNRVTEAIRDVASFIELDLKCDRKAPSYQSVETVSEMRDLHEELVNHIRYSAGEIGLNLSLDSLMNTDPTSVVEYSPYWHKVGLDVEPELFDKYSSQFGITGSLWESLVEILMNELNINSIGIAESLALALVSNGKDYILKDFNQSIDMQFIEFKNGFIDKYVPEAGKCDTVFGELLRINMKLNYRYFNDGDTGNLATDASFSYGQNLFGMLDRHLSESDRLEFVDYIRELGLDKVMIFEMSELIFAATLPMEVPPLILTNIVTPWLIYKKLENESFLSEENDLDSMDLNIDLLNRDGYSPNW